jgi:uncharacterized membrane protein YtjA (UPF0391 family)
MERVHATEIAARCRTTPLATSFYCMTEPGTKGSTVARPALLTAQSTRNSQRMQWRTESRPAPDRFRSLRSVAAILAGLVAIAALSLATDMVLHALEIYPPWGEPMHDTLLNAVALSYRCVYAVVGGYITARLAPRSPLRHALILGVVGMVLSALGGISATTANLGPIWFSVALVLISLPCAWIGAHAHRRSTT